MEKQKQARETAGRRVESARDTVRRRADGDLRDAAERLAEERERFKSQLGAAHADILRLGAEAADLERRNHELALAKNSGAVDWQAVPRGMHGDETVNHLRSDSGAAGNGDPSPNARNLPTGEGAAGGREEALRRDTEEKRDALRCMCNGLASDLKEAVEARSEAEVGRDMLVQVNITHPRKKCFRRGTEQHSHTIQFAMLSREALPRMFTGGLRELVEGLGKRQ